MDHKQFWNIVETTKREHADDSEEQAEAISDNLAALPPEEIVSFSEKSTTSFAFVLTAGTSGARHML